MVNRDGTDDRFLGLETAGFPAPMIPDGSKLAFIDAARRPVMVNPDGSGAVVLALALAIEVAWSFDWVHLAFVGRLDDSDPDHTYIVRSIGADLMVVTRGGCCVAWRP